MADTFTTNFSLTKPEVGASTDTWGVKLNANMDAIDAAVKGIKDQTDAATSANTANAIVRRDASGNIVVGTVTGSLAGNASTATVLQTARSISLTGDVSGSTTFNGSGNVSITAVVADDSHNHIIGNVDGLQAALDAKAPLASPGLSGTPTAPTAAVGTNTTQIATTAFVNAEIANDAPTKTGGGASGTWGINITGNAATATSATTAGSVTGGLKTVNGTSIIGSGNIAIDLSSRVAKTGDTMTGTLYLPAARIQSTSPTLDLHDTDWGTRYLHHNGGTMGFLNSGGGWNFYSNDAGQVWTQNYGWLHDCFFSTISNCAGGYGMGNVVVSNCGNISGARIELVDQGSNIRIQTSQWNYNCNCTCK